MTSSKSTKRALISGALAILMCVAMLIGTTLAWFTDTASTAVNKIQAGNLEIELQMKNNGSEWVNAEGKTLPFLVEGKIPAKGTQILWEPGCTYYVPEVRVVNKGNLAVKFEYVNELLGVTGKLAEVLEPVFKTPVDANGEEVNIEPEILKPDEASPAWSFGYHMLETAGNEYQNATATGMCLTVVATQATYENDSFNNQYDKDAQYPDVDVVTVTPDAIPSPFRANTAYFFEAGNYGDQHFVITDKENVTLIGKTGAKFDSLQISSIDYVNPSIGQEVDLDNSTLTVKGFEVAKTLMIVEADKNVVVEDNTAAQITVKANLSSQSIAVNNNIITGGDGAANSYGVYIVPNVTDYDLTVTGNSFTNVKSHAISVQGCGDGSAVTAAKSITVTGNTFTSYGTNNKTGRAAFKIWEDTKLAPNGTDPLNDAAKALAKSVNDNNYFATLGTNCVVADFYGKTVAFN